MNPPDNKRLAELIEAFLDHKTLERGIAPKTAALYRYWLGRFQLMLAEEAVAGEPTIPIKPPFRFMRSMGAAGAGYHTQRGIFGILHNFYGWAFDGGFITENPMACAQPPIERETVLQPCAEEGQVGAILAAIRRSKRKNWRRDFALYASIYSLGLRNGESVGLRPESIDWRAHAVWILGKGGKLLPLPMCRRLEAILRSWLKYRGSEPDLASSPWLFPSRPGPRGGRCGQLDTFSVAKTLRKFYLPAAGIQTRLTPHALRRGFGTELLLRNTHPRTIQTLLRHKSLETTMRYLRVTPEGQRRAVERLRWGEGSSKSRNQSHVPPS